MMEMSAGANSQGMESLDSGVFTYTELDPVTNAWFLPTDNLEEDVVLVFEPDTPRRDWKVGRTEAVYPGQE